MGLDGHESQSFTYYGQKTLRHLLRFFLKTQLVGHATTFPFFFFFFFLNIFPIFLYPFLDPAAENMAEALSTILDHGDKGHILGMAG